MKIKTFLDQDGLNLAMRWTVNRTDVLFFRDLNGEITQKLKTFKDAIKWIIVDWAKAVQGKKNLMGIGCLLILQQTSFLLYIRAVFYIFSSVLWCWTTCSVVVFFKVKASDLVCWMLWFKGLIYVCCYSSSCMLRAFCWPLGSRRFYECLFFWSCSRWFLNIISWEDKKSCKDTKTNSHIHQPPRRKTVYCKKWRCDCKLLIHTPTFFCYDVFWHSLLLWIVFSYL